MDQPEHIEEAAPARPAKWKVRLILAAILVIAFLLRTVENDSIPPGLFRDEAEKGYNAWSLIKTGRDYEGRRLPLFINAYGSHTSAIYQYCTAPIVGILGLNVRSTRLTAGIVGTLTVFFVFLLARAMFDPATALVAAFLLTISPWHVHFSRWAQQGIFLPLFFTIAAWGTVRFRREWRPGLPIAAAAIAFAAYAYAVGRVLAPLWLLVLFWACRKELVKHKALTLTSAIVLFVLVAPTLWFTFASSDQAMARFKNVSIVKKGASPQEIAGTFLLNYIKHFDPIYLFFRGDRQLRHSPNFVGQINPVEIPFLLFGLVFLFRRRDREAALIILGWLLIAPVASSLTDPKETPHALRSLAGVPAFSLLAAFGLVEALRRMPERSSRIAIAATVSVGELIVFGLFAYRYTDAYPRESLPDWQAGQRQVYRWTSLGALGGFVGGPRGGPKEAWISETIGGIVVPPDMICPAEIFTAFFERIPPAQFQKSRLGGTPYRVIRWGTDIKLLLTQPDRPPIILLAVVGEIPEALVKKYAGRTIRRWGIDWHSVPAAPE